MNWKSTAVVSGATLLATWLGWTPTRQLSEVTSAPAREVRPVSGGDIERQADRLQSRVRRELDYRDPTRNPFRFVPRPVVAASAAITEPTVTPAAPAIPSPTFTLSGMAADTIDGQLQRTAILTSASDVLFVKEGDHVAGGYTVTRVDANSVELTAAEGRVYRLTLTP